MKTLLISLLFFCSCSKPQKIQHSFLQDFVVIDKVYHIDDELPFYEYLVRDSFGKNFSITTTDHFVVGDHIEFIVKP